MIFFFANYQNYLELLFIQLLRRHDRNYNRNGWNADNGFAINSIGVPLLSPMSIPLAITGASLCEYEAMVQPRYRPRVIEDSVSSALSSQSTHWRGDKDIKRNGRPWRECIMVSSRLKRSKTDRRERRKRGRNGGRKEGRVDARNERSKGRRSDRAKDGFVSFHLSSPTASPSLSLSFRFFLSTCFFPSSASLPVSSFAMRRCVWSIVAAARVDSLITPPRPFRSPSPSLLSILFHPWPVLLLLLPIISYSRPMPANEKGKKVPKIQNPARKSSSMNASTRRRLALPWLPRNSSSSSYLPIFHVHALLSSSSSPFPWPRERGPRSRSFPFLQRARKRTNARPLVELANFSHSIASL